MVSPAISSNSFSSAAPLDPNDVNSLVTRPDANKHTSRLHKLSPRSVLAVIETIRCFTISALVYFAYHSCLLPTVLLASVATIAYVLKDRVKQLDAKNLGNTEKKTDQVASRTLGRSASISSQISNKTNFLSRADSIRSAAASLFFPIIEESLQELTSEKIKETFLGSIEDRVDNKPQWQGLLTICYLFLQEKQDEMPKSLNGLQSTKKYLKNKIGQYEKKGMDTLKNLEGDKGIYHLEKATPEQQVLRNAAPSVIMEIVQDLYTNLTKKEENQTDKDRFSKNADHAGKYAQQLRAFEELQKMHYTEDLKSPR